MLKFLLFFSILLSENAINKEIYKLMQEIILIKNYSEKIIKKIYLNKQTVNEPIEIIQSNHPYFSYAVIDSNLNLIIRTLTSEDEYNIRDQKKEKIHYFLENTYFIFIPEKKVHDISFSKIYTNIDENKKKANCIVLSKDYDLSIILFDIPNLELPKLIFLSTNTIYEQFTELADKHNGIESILYYEKTDKKL